MVSTQSRLEEIESQLDESIGVRPHERAQPQLSPVASPKDIGRRRLPGVGSIDIDQVAPDPDQPRQEFSASGITRLAESLKKYGQLAPIRVRLSERHDRWTIVCGERRWRAAKEAGFKRIDCVFDESNPRAAEILEQQLVENLLREDLTPIEQAGGFKSVMDDRGWTGKQVAAFLSVPESTVSRALALLDLPADVQQRVDAGELAARSAYEISKLPDENQQRELAHQAATGLTHAETRAAVLQKQGKKAKKHAKRGFSIAFPLESGIRITASSHADADYHQVLEALQQVAEEVQGRIDANIRLTPPRFTSE